MYYVILHTDYSDIYNCSSFASSFDDDSVIAGMAPSELMGMNYKLMGPPQFVPPYRFDDNGYFLWAFYKD